MALLHSDCPDNPMLVVSFTLVAVSILPALSAPLSSAGDFLGTIGYTG